MLHTRLTRNYVAAFGIVLVFLVTFHFLSTSGVDISEVPGTDSSNSHTGSSKWSIPAWKDWSWPSYSKGSKSSFADDSQLAPEKGTEAFEESESSEYGYLKEEIVTSTQHEYSIATASSQPANKAQSQSTASPTASSTAASKPVKVISTLDPQNSTFEVTDLPYNPAGVDPSQVVLLTASDGKGHNGGIENILEMTEQNRKSYCEYHGYNYHFINISKYDLKDAHPVWAKLPAIIETFQTFPEAQWVWWLDLDAIIMSPKQDLNSLILSKQGMSQALLKSTEYNRESPHRTGIWTSPDPDLSKIDILMSQDHNGLNAGSFMLRRSKFTQLLLDLWSDPVFVLQDWPGQEQETISHIMQNHPVVRDHLGLINQRVINAYPIGGDEMGWRDGDLVVHFAGCWVEQRCQEQWEENWHKRDVV